MPKKIGRPPENDLLVIRQMVELRASNPKLSLRAAAKKAARMLGLTGQPIERLRKKFAALKKADELPAHESEVERKRREIQEGLAAIETKKAELRARLVSKEQEAALLGMSTANRKDLSVVIMTLTNEREQCEQVLHGPADIAIDKYLSAGLSAAEADAQFVALAQRYERVKQEEEVLREIVHLREVLRMDRGVPTQNGEEVGQKPESPG